MEIAYLGHVEGQNTSVGAFHAPLLVKDLIRTGKDMFILFGSTLFY